VSEEGVEFRSNVDGKKIFLSPERAMQVQASLGSDMVSPPNPPSSMLNERSKLPSPRSKAFDYIIVLGGCRDSPGDRPLIIDCEIPTRSWFWTSVWSFLPPKRELRSHLTGRFDGLGAARTHTGNRPTPSIPIPVIALHPPSQYRQSPYTLHPNTGNRPTPSIPIPVIALNPPLSTLECELAHQKATSSLHPNPLPAEKRSCKHVKTCFSKPYWSSSASLKTPTPETYHFLRGGGAVFGIVQGGAYESLRLKSLQGLLDIGKHTPDPRRFGIGGCGLPPQHPSSHLYLHFRPSQHTLMEMLGRPNP
jgi:hypothetical protein